MPVVQINKDNLILEVLTEIKNTLPVIEGVMQKDNSEINETATIFFNHLSKVINLIHTDYEYKIKYNKLLKVIEDNNALKVSLMGDISEVTSNKILIKTVEDTSIKVSLDDTSEVTKLVSVIAEDVRFIRERIPSREDLVQIMKLRNQKELVSKGEIKPAAKYDGNVMVKMFVNDNKTCYAIAKEIGCSVGTVEYQLKQRGIKTNKLQ